MQQTFANYASAVTVTPSDTAPINCRAIYVGGTGAVSVKTQAGLVAVVFAGLPTGTLLPVMIDGGQIMATGTTATQLLALA